MDIGQDSAVQVLNDLIETTLESAQGYGEAAETACDGRLRSLFAERSRRRLAVARRLQQEARTFGPAASDPAEAPRKVAECFGGLKTALQGGRGQSAVIDEVERGEAAIMGRFEDALQTADLSDCAREAVSLAYEAIRADQDDIGRHRQAVH